MDTKLRSTINLTEGTEEEVVVLTKDRQGEGIDEDVKVAEAERKPFTEVLARDLFDMEVTTRLGSHNAKSTKGLVTPRDHGFFFE